MRIVHTYNKTKYYIKTYGLKKTIAKVFSILKLKISAILNRKRDAETMARYNSWIENNEPTDEELELQRKHKFKLEPKISIIVPMYNTPEIFFNELVDCLINQTYSNWELCLADGSPEKNEELNKTLEKDERIKYKFIGENKGISGNTNEALTIATGDFVALLDHDDLIPVFSLYEIVKAINENPDVEFIYTDEDKIIADSGIRVGPYFKPDFSIDTLRANNYITHFSIFKKELMDKIGGFKEKYNGAQDYDVIIRAAENTQNIVHIPKILYHWRIHPQSTAMAADAKPYAYEAGIRVLEDHLERQGLKGKVSHGGDIPGIYQIEYEVVGNPKVSILIPNKDNVKLLKRCIKSILTKTTYKNYEIVVIENNSKRKSTFKYYESLEKLDNVRVIKYPEKGFNYSKIINFGVKNCDSEFVMQLNNDTELLTPNWLEKFIGFARQKRCRNSRC